MPDIREQFVALGLALPREEKPSIGKNEVLCLVCKKAVHKLNHDQHLKEQHGIVHKVKKKKCTHCGVEVSAKNLKRHVQKFHGGEKKQRKKKTLTSKQARSQFKALNDNKLSGDKSVRAYLDRVDDKPKYGKFGIPQDKYRWGFYGHSSMVYDLWRRN